MKDEVLLRRLISGHTANVRFADLTRLVESFGFELKRVNGSHHIFRHVDTGVQLNLQKVRGKAKPYQVRQFLKILERYNLKRNDND